MRSVRLALLLLFSLTWSGVQAGSSYPMQAEQVAPGVYAVITPTRSLPNPQNRGWNSNSAFVVTGQGVLLVDSGSSTTIGEALRRVIAGVTDQPVRWIINSHGHGDHWLGNAAFKDTVEQVIATTQVQKIVRFDGKTWVDNFNRMTEGATGDSAVLPPDTVVDERTELDLGGNRVVVFPSGNSHSPGDLIAWLPAQRVLISGDVVYSDRMPSTNVSNLARWIEQLDELQALQPAVVIPGHGKVTDADGLMRLRRLLADYWQAVEKGYKAGKSDFEMVADVADALSGYRDDYPGMDEKIPRDLPHVYLQVEAASF
jgi:glyoxylase-like metal-dependent hydrolase (beta-lactamase superfamily II)